MVSYDTIWYLLHVIVFIENLIILSKCKYLSKNKICLIHKLHRLCMQSKFILVNLIANEKHESQYSYSLCIRTEVWHFVFSFDNLIMLIYTQFLSKWLEYWNSTTYISSIKTRYLWYRMVFFYVNVMYQYMKAHSKILSISVLSLNLNGYMNMTFTKQKTTFKTYIYPINIG